MKPERRESAAPTTRPERREESKSPSNPRRRRFLRWGLRLGVLAFLGVGFWGRQALRVDRVRIPFPDLPPAFQGFRIAQISDLHASFWVPRSFLETVVERVNRLEADLVVATGDFVTGAVNQLWRDGSRTDYAAQVAETLAGLRARDIYGVLGNHDQGRGETETRALTARLEAAGIRMLRNRSTTLRRGDARLHLAGTDDHWHSGDVDAALRTAPETGPTVLLAHNPDAVADIPARRRVGLSLCGHTHGGQVVIPFLTRRILPVRRPARYMAGLVREAHGFTYVNRGIGTLVFPFRIGAPPEITEITLV